MTKATAGFPAQYVADRAKERIADLERLRAAARDKRIAEIMATPIISGLLWWKSERLPDREEAEKIYDNPVNYFPPSYWTESRYWRPLGRLRDLHRLALAALDANETATAITLTADDCRDLGIPANFGDAA